MPSLAPSRSFPPAIASAGSEIDHLISSLGESVETGPTEQIKPEISEPAPVEKNSGQFVSTVVTLVLVLLFVTAIVGAIAFEGSAQARSRGLLLMVLGAVSCCLMMGETNQFVKIRNGLFFFPLGFVLLLGGLFAIVTGELPAWLIDIMNGLLDRLKRAGR